MFLGSFAEFAKVWVNEILTIYEKFVRKYLGKSGKMAEISHSCKSGNVPNFGWHAFLIQKIPKKIRIILKNCAPKLIELGASWRISFFRRVGAQWVELIFALPRKGAPKQR